jgi:hypothetical protein
LNNEPNLQRFVIEKNLAQKVMRVHFEVDEIDQVKK